MQGFGLNIIEQLYRANEVFVKDGNHIKLSLRIDYQHGALTELKLLIYLADLASEQGCILPR